MGSVLGSFYVASLIERSDTHFAVTSFTDRFRSRLTNSTGNASSVYVEFGHDSSLSLALTGLGLVK